MPSALQYLVFGAFMIFVFLAAAPLLLIVAVCLRVAAEEIQRGWHALRTHARRWQPRVEPRVPTLV
jgi:hypothetical protein